jgi:hypothetical protein
LGLAFTRRGETSAWLKAQQFDQRILLRGLARNATMVVSQALFQIGRAPDVIMS